MKIHQAGTTVTLQPVRGGRRPYCDTCMRFLSLAMRNAQVLMEIAVKHLDTRHPARRLPIVRDKHVASGPHAGMWAQVPGSEPVGDIGDTPEDWQKFINLTDPQDHVFTNVGRTASDDPNAVEVWADDEKWSIKESSWDAFVEWLQGEHSHHGQTHLHWPSETSAIDTHDHHGMRHSHEDDEFPFSVDIIDYI